MAKNLIPIRFWMLKGKLYFKPLEFISKIHVYYSCYTINKLLTTLPEDATGQLIDMRLQARLETPR